MIQTCFKTAFKGANESGNNRSGNFINNKYRFLVEIVELKNTV
jgi:hypothetical protein